MTKNTKKNAVVLLSGGLDSATAMAVAVTGESLSVPLLLGSGSIIGGMMLILSRQ